MPYDIIEEAAPASGGFEILDEQETPGELSGIVNSYRRGNLAAQRAIEAVQMTPERGPTLRQERRGFVQAMEDPEYLNRLMAAGDDPAAMRRVESLYGPGRRVEAMTDPQRQANIATAGAIADLSKRADAIPQSAAMQEWAKANNSNWWQVFARNPVEITANIFAESLPQAAPTMAATMATGGMGRIASATAGGAGSFGIEAANSLIDAAASQGVDLHDPEQVRAFFSDENKVKAAREFAMQRGLPIGLLDALTVGVAGKFLKPALGKGVARVAGATAAEAGAQMAGGAGGEALAQVASGQDLSLRDIAAEAIGELATAPGEVISNLREEMRSGGGKGRGFEVIEDKPKPAAPTVDDLKALQAAMRGNQLKPVETKPAADPALDEVVTALRGENPEAPRLKGALKPVQPEKAGDIAEAGGQTIVVERPAELTEEQRAAIEQVKRQDAEVAKFVENPDKNYEGMGRLELELLEGMGDARATAALRRLRARKFANVESPGANVGTPAANVGSLVANVEMLPSAPEVSIAPAELSPSSISDTPSVKESLPVQPKPETDAARVRREAKEFDKLLLDYGMEAGWVRAPEVLYDEMASVQTGHGTASIKAKILRSKEMAGVRRRAAQELGAADFADMGDARKRAALLPKLRELVEQRFAGPRKQAEAFSQATTAGKVPVPIGELKVGDTLNVEGDLVRVVEVSPDGEVTLQDGTRFGRQVMQDGSTIYAEEWQSEPADTGAGFEAVEEPAQPAVKESLTVEQKATEQAKAVPTLKGGQAQGDLLGSGDVEFNLYAERTGDGEREAAARQEAEQTKQAAKEFEAKNQPELINEQNEWIGPVWHGSPDFIGRQFDRMFLGRETGISRGGFSFTKDKTRAETFTKQRIDPDQLAVDLANEAMREAKLTLPKTAVFRNFTYEDLPEFNVRHIDDSEGFREWLRELAAEMPPSIAAKLEEASRAGKKAPNPRLIQAYIRNPRTVDVHGEKVLIVDDPRDIHIVESDKEDAIESALDKLKIETPPGSLQAFGLLPETWNQLIEIVRAAYRAGKTAAHAIRAGMDWLQAQGVRDYDAAGIQAALERTMNVQAVDAVDNVEGMSPDDDYHMSHRPRDDGPRAFDLLENEIAPRDIYEHPEWYSGEPGSKSYLESVRALRSVRGKPDAPLKVYRAAPKKQLNRGDWIALSKTYAAQHGMADDPRNDVPVHEFTVPASAVRWAGDSIEEYGYYPETDAIESALDKLKIETPPGSLQAFGLLPEMWNGLVEAVRLAYRGGKSIAQAIEDGLAWLQATHGEQQFDEAAVRAELQSIVHGADADKPASIRAQLNNLGAEMDAIRARGEEIPQAMLDQYKDLADTLGEEIRSGRGTTGQERIRVDENLEENPRRRAAGAEAYQIPQWRGEQRLPAGRLRDLFTGLKGWRERAGNWLARRQERMDVTIGRDAADNRAAQSANEASLHVRLALNRAFDTAPGEVRTKHETREAALTFVVEADGDRAKLAEFHEQIATSEFSETKAARQAMAAIEYAEAHWEKLQQAAERYRVLSEAERETELNEGVNSAEWRGGYVYHRWAKESPSGGADPTQSTPAGTPFRKSRSVATYAEGIAAGRKPQTLNALELLAERVAAGQRRLNELSWVHGLRNMIDPVTDMPVVVDVIKKPRKPVNLPAPGSPAAQAMEAAGETYKPEWQTIAPEGYKLWRLGDLEVAVQENFAGLLTKLTAPSFFKGAGVKKAFGALKSALLMFDTFHLGRMVAWRQMFGLFGGYQKGQTLLDFSTADIREMAARGEIPEAWADGLIENKRRLNLAIRTGFNIGNVLDNSWGDALHNLPGIGTFNKWLFGQYQRGAMAEAWLIEFERMSRALPNVPEAKVARRVSADLNARFGNLNRQGLFKSRTAQDLARFVFLAPQWNESLIRSELGAIGQAIKAPIESVQQRRLVYGTLMKATGLMAVGTFLANQILNFAFRWKPTWDNDEEEWDKKISAYIPDAIGGGPGFFLNPLALPMEYTHLIEGNLHRSGGDMSEALRRVLVSRLHAGARPVEIFLNRKDPLGRKLRDGEVLPAMAKALIPAPIASGTVLAAGKQLATGEPSEQYPGQYQKQLMASFGLKTDQAPNPEQRVRSLAREFNKSKGIEPSAEFFTGDYDELNKALRIGNKIDARAAFDELLKKRTPREVYDHYKRAAVAPFTGQRGREKEFWRGLTPKQREVYEQARAARKDTSLRAVAMLKEVMANQDPALRP